MPSLPTTAGAYAPTIAFPKLVGDLQIGDKNMLELTSGTGGQPKGGILVLNYDTADLEVVYYGEYSGGPFFYFLRRAMNGTLAVKHLDGANVMLYSYGSNLSIQAHLLNLEQRMQDAGF